VEQRNGKSVFSLALLRKSICSLHDPRTLMQAANECYFAFMACIDNPNAGQRGAGQDGSTGQDQRPLPARL
jgi:hypothetical protein